MEELWQTEFDGDERACDVHISNLRQKVERDPQNPELVLTVRGVGYKFDGQSSLSPGPARRFRTAVSIRARRHRFSPPPCEARSSLFQLRVREGSPFADEMSKAAGASPRFADGPPACRASPS